LGFQPSAFQIYRLIYWPCDDAWRILPGEKKITAIGYGGVAGNTPVALKWDAMTVSNPPVEYEYPGK